MAGTVSGTLNFYSPCLALSSMFAFLDCYELFLQPLVCCLLFSSLRQAPLVTRSNNFLYDFINLSYQCGGILVHPSFQHCFSLLRFAGICFCTDLLMCHYSILIGLISPDFDWAMNLIFFFSHAVVNLQLPLGSLSFCMTQFWPSVCFQTNPSH